MLLKYVAQAIPAYCMNSFLLHVSLSQELELMMNYMYPFGGALRLVNSHWMDWNRLCS